MQNLEGDRPVVAQVLGEEDGGHAAAPELTLESVRRGKGRLQRGAQVRQTGLLVEGDLIYQRWGRGTSKAMGGVHRVPRGDTHGPHRRSAAPDEPRPRFRVAPPGLEPKAAGGQP
jgi:hypothetical protein